MEKFPKLMKRQGKREGKISETDKETGNREEKISKRKIDRETGEEAGRNNRTESRRSRK